MALMTSRRCWRPWKLPKVLELNSPCRGHEGNRVVQRSIGREELKEKMNRGDDFILVDTMASMYYRHSHLPGAINLPVDEIRERAPKSLPDKNAEIVVYCIDPP